MNKRTYRSGFTLVELLITIAIIAILATIIITSFGGAKESSRISKAQAEMSEFKKVAMIAQSEKDSTLAELTGAAGGLPTAHSCEGKDIRQISDQDFCYKDWVAAVAKIQNSTNVSTGLEGLKRDPWESPYGLYENERRSGSSNCVLDEIRAAGKDGELKTADDIVTTIPFSKPCP